MLSLVPLHRDHLFELERLGQLRFFIGADDKVFEALEKNVGSMSILDEEGQVLACGGTFQHWENRAEVWVVFHPELASKRFLEVFKVSKRFVDAQNHRRLEATSEHGPMREQSRRFIEALGFELEAECLKRYTVQGLDVSVYSRIRE